MMLNIQEYRSLKFKLAFRAIKSFVKMHFKDEKEAAQQKVTLIFQVLFAKSKTNVALSRHRTLAI